MITQRDIKNTYYDALFFASSTTNEKKDFFLRGAEFRILLKLIHYSSNEENITWSSENISKHLTTSVDSIDKNIQRLRQKGYINVINKQRNATTRSRTIYINWEFILEVDGLYNAFINTDETQVEVEVKTEIETPVEVIETKSETVQLKQQVLISDYDDEDEEETKEPFEFYDMNDKSIPTDYLFDYYQTLTFSSQVKRAMIYTDIEEGKIITKQEILEGTF